jgi:hypothetical protein
MAEVPEVPKAPVHSDGKDKQPEIKPGGTSPELANGNQGHGVKPTAADSQRTLKSANVPDPEGKELLSDDAKRAGIKPIELEIPGSHSQMKTKGEPQLENKWDDGDKAKLKGTFTDSTVDKLRAGGFPQSGIPDLAVSGMSNSSVEKLLNAGASMSHILEMAKEGATAQALSKSSVGRLVTSSDINVKANDLAAAYASKSPEGLQKLTAQGADQAERAQAMLSSIDSRLKSLMASSA